MYEDGDDVEYAAARSRGTLAAADRSALSLLLRASGTSSFGRESVDGGGGGGP